MGCLYIAEYPDWGRGIVTRSSSTGRGQKYIQVKSAIRANYHRYNIKSSTTGNVRHCDQKDIYIFKSKDVN
jgi:hypothetical protein